jgi:ribose transport system substrate-binding protein
VQGGGARRPTTINTAKAESPDFAETNKEYQLIKSKRMGAITAAAFSALLFAGCATDTAAEDTSAADDTTAAAEETLFIPLISKGFQHQFWQAVKLGAELEAAELGVEITFEGPASETEVQAQLDMFQTALDKNPDAIGYATLDPEACVSYMEQAKERGIPVVQFDAGCNSDYPLNLAATDGKAAGAIAADNMARLMGEEGEVGIVSHSQINSTGVERRDGFAEQMAAAYPNITIVDVQYGDGDHLKSADIAKAMIAAYPNLKGLYATNEGSAVGIVNAVTELALTAGELIIVGFDSGAAQVEAIKSGVMAGAITQDPIGIGRAVVRNAVAAIRGETLPTFTDTGAFWYDATNYTDENIAAVLYD